MATDGGRVTIACRLTALPGHRVELVRQLERILAVSHREPETEMYIISIAPADDVSVWLFEMFVDQAAYEHHRASAVHEEVVGLLPTMCQPDGLLAVLQPMAMKVAFAGPG